MKTISAATALIYSCVCQAQQPHTGWNSEPLLGKVKSVYRSSEVLAISTLELETKPLDTTFYTVDSFDKEGLQVYSSVVKNDTITDVVSFDYIFDNKGILIEQSYSYNDKYTFNRLNKNIVRRLFEYDSTGKIVAETQYSLNNRLDVRKKYSYLSNLLVKEEDSTHQGITRITYKYNDKQQLCEKIIDFTYQKLNHIATTKYSYDATGHLTTEIWKSNANTRISNFNIHGHEIRSGIFSIQYSYDSHGNWTHRLEGIQEGYIRIDVRKITYY